MTIKVRKLLKDIIPCVDSECLMEISCNKCQGKAINLALQEIRKVVEENNMCKCGECVVCDFQDGIKELFK